MWSHSDSPVSGRLKNERWTLLHREQKSNFMLLEKFSHTFNENEKFHISGLTSRSLLWKLHYFWHWNKQIPTRSRFQACERQSNKCQICYTSYTNKTKKSKRLSNKPVHRKCTTVLIASDDSPHSRCEVYSFLDIKDSFMQTTKDLLKTMKRFLVSQPAERNE